MARFLVLMVLLLSVLHISMAAVFEWSRLLKGPTVYPPVSFRGVSTTTGNPGGRGNHAYAWDDVNEELWIYGGNFVIPGNTTKFSDLWKYTASTGRWTWYSGYTGAARNLGAIGVERSTNAPGVRESSFAWYHAGRGEFWMYGGWSGNCYTDLWRFNASSMMWTWMSGVSGFEVGAVYGSKGIPATGNHPGSRGMGASWVDGTNLYLFGGNLLNNAGLMDLDNVMRYNVVANTWTWISGTTGTRGAGSYGPLNTFSSAYWPSARHMVPHAFDKVNRRLWIYSGTAYSSNGLSDVWCFRLLDETWAVMSSANTARLAANFGPIGVESSTFSPGTTTNAVAWFDSSDNTFWIFGGYAWDKVSARYAQISTTLWRFRVQSDSWTIVAGTNVSTPAATPSNDAPNVYWGSAVGWSQTRRKLTLYGGSLRTTSNFDEVWQFGESAAVSNPPTYVAPPLVSPASASGPAPATPTPSNLVGPVGPPQGVTATPGSSLQAPSRAPATTQPTLSPSFAAPVSAIRNPPISSPTQAAAAPLAPIAQIFVSVVGQTAPNSSYVAKVCATLAESYSPPLTVGSDLVCRVTSSVRRNFHGVFVIVGDVLTRTAADAVLSQNVTSTNAVTQLLSRIDPQYSVSAVSTQAIPVSVVTPTSQAVPTLMLSPISSPDNASPSNVGFVVSSSVKIVPLAALVVGVIGAFLCC